MSKAQKFSQIQPKAGHSGGRNESAANAEFDDVRDHAVGITTSYCKHCPQNLKKVDGVLASSTAALPQRSTVKKLPRLRKWLKHSYLVKNCSKAKILYYTVL